MNFRLFGIEELNENTTIEEARGYIIDIENSETIKAARNTNTKLKTQFDCIVASILYSADDNECSENFKQYRKCVDKNDQSVYWVITHYLDKNFGSFDDIAKSNNPLCYRGLRKTDTLAQLYKLFSAGIVSEIFSEVDDTYKEDDNTSEKNLTKRQKFLKWFMSTNDIELNGIEGNVADLIIDGGARQIILTGAPGTGKTRSAKRIAEKRGAELEINGEMRPYQLVQFHPSYDYTDFVEGLRPIENDKKEMSFVRMDGHFKGFCRKVVEANKAGGDCDKLYFFIIDEINRADLSKVFGELMYCLEKDKRVKDVNDEDEIKKKSILTQYHNLTTHDIEGEDVFKNGFYIPENVVIIGTMNDIDRSVESMDFALRRRFEWKEFEVTEKTLKEAFKSMFNEEFANELAKCVDNLNINGIAGEKGKEFGLNRQYYISQGQFANLPDHITHAGTDEILEYAWDHRIEPLLREYLRGEDESEIGDFIKDCADALGVKDDTESK